MKYLLLGHGVANNGAKKLLDMCNLDYDYLDIPEVKDEYDIIVKSPGISLNDDFFKCRNEEVISDIELGYRLVKPYIIAVTGSNGKTTVSSMIAHGLNRKYKTVLCGNIGYSFCEALADNMDKDIFVVEVSSFQLEGTNTFDPNIALILNISPCHLDHHGSYNSYIESKIKIAKNQSVKHKLIYTLDSPFLKKINKEIISESLSFSYDNINSNIYYYDGYIYYLNNKVMKIKEKIKSFSYKISNYMAVVGVLKEFGYSNLEIKKSIYSFKDVKYRLERLRFNIYNDAKSTNCASTKAALLGLNNVLLICGGYDRGIDIVLPEEALDRIVSVYAYGASKNKIKDFMDMHDIECHIYNNLNEAFVDAYNNLSKERNLLYSPMCASFDQYESYVKRAEEFERLIKSIK